MEYDPQNMNDEQLDALLGDVRVPADLKDSLLQIVDTAADPVRPDIADPRRRSNGVYRGFGKWMLVLAASVLAIAAFLAWQWIGGLNRIQLVRPADGDPASGAPAGIANSPELARIDAEIASVNAVLRQLELADKQREFTTVQRAYSLELSRREVSSVIVALSEQHALPLGGTEENVESRLADVILSFPDTRGAELASEFLARLKN